MSIRKLAESKNYTITSEYEKVYLYNKADSSSRVIGDFYGDPEGALIDKQERFAVMFGDGVIVYRLCPPFRAYSCDTECEQWTEYGRYEPVMWTESASLDGNTLSLQTEEGTVVIDINSRK